MRKKAAKNFLHRAAATASNATRRNAASEKTFNGSPVSRRGSLKSFSSNSSKTNRRTEKCFSFLIKLSQIVTIILGLTFSILVLAHFLPNQSGVTTSSLASTTRDIWSQSQFQFDASIYNPLQVLHEAVSPGVQPNPNRTIAIVHVGKAGGVSLRRLTIVFCKLFFRAKKYDGVRDQKIQSCIERQFPDKKATLTHQTQYYFHLDEYNETELASATTFLITLRNPVERIISTYRFSHPGNCNENNRKEVWRPRGCEAERHKYEPGLVQNQIYYRCFPSPAMENFAQALMKPWVRDQGWGPTLSQEERRECRYMAREMVEGHGTFGSAPHMLYNYAFYAQRSIWKFPDKEVFGIRQEYFVEDIFNLDKMIGGNANLKEDRDVSHGSESYAPSPLSTEAYHKICCVLEQEIEIYADIVNRVVNLNTQQKQDAIKDVYTKCGVDEAGGWTEWRFKCRRQMRKDLRFLKPSLVVDETKMIQKASQQQNKQT